MDKSSVINFPNNDELKASNEALKRNMPALIEYSVIVASLRKAAYENYIKEGFTPEQALYLCQSTFTQ